MNNLNYSQLTILLEKILPRSKKQIFDPILIHNISKTKLADIITKLKINDISFFEELDVTINNLDHCLLKLADLLSEILNKKLSNFNNCILKE